MSEIAELKEEIAQLRTNLTLANERISQLTNTLELKVDKADIISQINISPEGVSIDAKQVNIINAK